MHRQIITRNLNWFLPRCFFKISLGTCLLLFSFFSQNGKNKTNGPYYCVSSCLSEGWVLCQAVPFSFRSTRSALLSLLNDIEAKLKFLFASLKCWLWRAWWECGVFTGGQDSPCVLWGGLGSWRSCHCYLFWEISLRKMRKQTGRS